MRERKGWGGELNMLGRRGARGEEETGVQHERKDSAYGGHRVTCCWQDVVYCPDGCVCCLDVTSC